MERPFDRNSKPSRFRSLLLASCAVAGAAFWCWRFPHALVFTLLAATIALWLAAAFVPKWHRPVHRAMEGCLEGCLKLLTWLLLGVVYAMVFTVGRILMLALRKEPLKRRLEPGRESYWEVPARPSDKEASYLRQY